MDYSEGDDGHMPVCRGVSSGDILHEAKKKGQTGELYVQAVSQEYN